MRVVVFGERLAPPPDEGIKKLTLAVGEGLRALGHEVLALTSGAGDWPEQAVRGVDADRLLRSPALAKLVGSFRPEAVIYVPTASLTLASGLRAHALRRHAGGAPVALFGTQGRRHSVAVRLAARFAAPDICATQSAATERQARALGWRALRLPPGVDRGAFRPRSAAHRAALRAQFDLPRDAFIVLHAGHLNRSRGLADLVAIADLALPVLAGSTSTARDESLAGELQRAGVKLILRYIPNIADLYLASDAYLFPVPPDPVAASSIDLPLSVLEAAACDLPIVSTRFGGLPELWPAAPGLSYYDSTAALRAAIEPLRAGIGHGAGTAALAEPYGWEGVAQRLLAALTAPAQRP